MNMYKTIIIFSILFSVISKSISIINGNKTNIETYPWMASIIVGDHLWFDKYTCAGTIIGSKWVITSAHCFVDYPWYSTNYFYVRVGSNSPDSDGDPIKVNRWIIHEESNINDLAVIELVSEIHWKYPTHPIELINEDFEIIKGLVVRTASFGDTCDECATSSQLYELCQKTCIPITNLGTNYEKFDNEQKERIMCSEDENEKSTGLYI